MHLGPRHYALTWLGLLGLTAVSYFVSGVDLGALSTPIALLIATVKGLLVALFFMHLAAARFGYQLAMMVALALVLLMIGLTAGDVVLRDAVEVVPGE